MNIEEIGIEFDKSEEDLSYKHFRKKGKRKLQITTQLKCKIRIGYIPFLIIIPKGYRTDGYSIPKWIQPFAPDRLSMDLRPAILHDYFCDNKKEFTEEFASKSFYAAMKSVGISSRRAKKLYLGVRLAQTTKYRNEWRS